MNDSYLVNIVANDFKHGDTIFEPFLLNATNLGKSVNGVVEGVKSLSVNGVGGLVNGVKSLVNGQTANGVNGH